MWIALAFLSAFLLGCYDVNKKMSLNGNAVLPVLFLNTLISSLIFVPFIILSFCTDYLDGTMLYVPHVSFETHVAVFVKAVISVYGGLDLLLCLDIPRFHDIDSLYGTS